MTGVACDPGTKSINQAMSDASFDMGGDEWLDDDGRLKFETYPDNLPDMESYWFDVVRGEDGTFYLNAYQLRDGASAPIGERALPWRTGLDASARHVVVLARNIVAIHESGGLID